MSLAVAALSVTPLLSQWQEGWRCPAEGRGLRLLMASLAAAVSHRLIFSNTYCREIKTRNLTFVINITQQYLLGRVPEKSVLLLFFPPRQEKKRYWLPQLSQSGLLSVSLWFVSVLRPHQRTWSHLFFSPPQHLPLVYSLGLFKVPIRPRLIGGSFNVATSSTGRHKRIPARGRAVELSDLARFRRSDVSWWFFPLDGTITIPTELLQRWVVIKF